MFDEKKYRREYMKKWRDENIDKVREQCRQRYQKNRERVREQQAAYRARHPRRLVEKRKKRRDANPEGAKLYAKTWRINNPERVQAMTLRGRLKKLGIDPRIVSPKPKECQVCGSETKISLDHCHERMVFRGWICHKCNVILGMAGDDAQRLRKLAKYLEKK